MRAHVDTKMQTQPPSSQSGQTVSATAPISEKPDSLCWTRRHTALVLLFPIASFAQVLVVALIRQSVLSLPYHALALAFLALAFSGTLAGDLRLANALAAIAAMPPAPASETGSERDRAITLALVVNIGMLVAYTVGSLLLGFVAYNTPSMGVLYAAPYILLSFYVIAVYLRRQNGINALDAEDTAATAAALAAAADRAATNDAAIVADVRRMLAEKLDDAAIAVAVRTKYFVLER